MLDLSPYFQTSFYKFFLKAGYFIRLFLNTLAFWIRFGLIFDHQQIRFINILLHAIRHLGRNALVTVHKASLLLLEDQGILNLIWGKHLKALFCISLYNFQSVCRVSRIFFSALCLDQLNDEKIHSKWKHLKLYNHNYYLCKWEFHLHEVIIIKHKIFDMRIFIIRYLIHY